MVSKNGKSETLIVTFLHIVAITGNIKLHFLVHLKRLINFDNFLVIWLKRSEPINGYKNFKLLSSSFSNN